eukprot:2081728-Rhodomonas_salina.1
MPRFERKKTFLIEEWCYVHHDTAASLSHGTSTTAEPEPYSLRLGLGIQGSAIMMVVLVPWPPALCILRGSDTNLCHGDQ